jgi:diguanylate cyclase (GGDEF)-like protein/PAS domain S-box-containing protein
MGVRPALRALVDATPPAARPTPRTTVPFVGLAILGMVALLLPPYPRPAGHVTVAVALFAVLLALHLTAVRRPSRTWLDVAAPFGAFPLVVVMRDATGGADSGLAPLMAVPLFWLALFGARRDLTVAAVLVVLTFLAPVLLVGGAAYPPGEWRRALVWGGVAVVVAPAVHAVVRRLEVQTQRSRDAAARVEGIMRGATLSSLVTTDPDGVVTSFSTGAEQQLGYRAADVVGKELTSFLFVRRELREVADELGVPIGFPVLARLAHRRSQSRIWTLVRADRQQAFVWMAVTELRDEDDRIDGYLCVAIDATSAIRSQRALTFAEERWRILLDHLPDTTVVMVEEGTGITVVTGAGSLAGRLRDGAGGRLTEIVDRAAPGAMQRLLAQAFAGRDAAPVHAFVDGQEHELVASALPSPTDRRQALLMIRDVSQERLRERTLTEAKERAERLFDDAPQGIALLDTEGVVVQVNPALVGLLGGAELLGRRLSVCSFAPEDPTVGQHLRRVLSAPEHRAETQWSVRGADGEELHVVLTSTVLKGADTAVGSGDLVLTNVVDVSERHRYERQLAFLAEHDPLTGLANRRRFDQRLERHVDECRRYGARGAVLMLDLDHFKQVNDTLGHTMGDQLLRDVAGVLARRMRSTDLVARLGGDEFAILLPHADRKAAELVAADVVGRIRREVRSHDDTRRQVSVSLGGATVEPMHTSATELLSAADAAMYVAKNSGRDRYTFLSVPGAV